MPMTQADIRKHYEREWKQRFERAGSEDDLRFSSTVEDRVLYPIYEQLLSDLNIPVDGSRLLDVGCGSGRWVRFFLERYRPAALVGMDCAEGSVDILKKWADPPVGTELSFHVGDITAPTLPITESFNLINIANVLFHIPENDLYLQAMRNLASLVSSTGRIVTTEYMPRTTIRTEWMLVRSRYEFEAIVASVGLRIAAIRATGFFGNDPMGLDGPDNAVRQHFHRVRAYQQQILTGNHDAQTRTFLVDYLAEIERATLAFCRERIADVDLPSQKLVVLAPVG